MDTAKKDMYADEGMERIRRESEGEREEDEERKREREIVRVLGKVKKERDE